MMLISLRKSEIKEEITNNVNLTQKSEIEEAIANNVNESQKK
jgi:hypothetical protein